MHIQLPCAGREYLSIQRMYLLVITNQLMVLYEITLTVEPDSSKFEKNARVRQMTIM